MDNMNNNFNSYNDQYPYNQNPQYNQYSQYDQYYQQPAAPKAKKGRLRTVIALIAAVAVVGGGAGFGGALAASALIKTGDTSASASVSEAPAASESSAAESSSSDSTSGKSDVSSDISSALDAITTTTQGVSAVKTDPKSVSATGENGAYTASELYEAVNDTIVLIKVYTDGSDSYSSYYDYYNYYFGYGSDKSKDKESEPVYSGYGSGIVFTEDGYVLTNAHVVKDAVKLEVVVNDYEDADKTYTYEAKVIGSDSQSDIAVIKIERDEPFLAAKLGDSDTLKVGQNVCAIGNPGVTAKIMFDHTMTAGIISGLNIECLSESGYALSLIQTDAAINSGNSGGGLFDMYGNVIGVVNEKIIANTYEGLGFALTINEVKPIMQDLLKYGCVKSRPVLGITTVALNETRAQLYGAKLSQGLLVASLNEGAPVEKSGLKISDIITKINGQTVAELIDVQQIISKFKVGDTVTLTVARENMAGGMDSIDIDVELTSASSN